MACVKILKSVSEEVDRRLALPLLIVDLLYRLIIIQQFLKGIIFISDLEELKLVAIFHAHLLADKLLQVSDLTIMDWCQHLYSLQIG